MKLKILNLTNLFMILTIILGWYVTVFIIEPFLHYNFQQIGFLSGHDFFSGFSSYPGGIADYLSVFISQFFKFNAFGSFLIVAVVSMQGFLAFNLVKQLAGNFNLRYSVFAIILLFGIVVLCDYRYPYYASIRLLFAYIFVWGFNSFHSRSARYSVFLWPLPAVLLLYLAGSPALFVFTLSTAFIVGFTGKHQITRLFAPVFLILGGLFPYLAYKYMFQITLRNMYDITMIKPPEQLAYTQGMPLYIYYSLLPIIILAGLLFQKISEKRKGTKEKGTKAASKILFFKRAPFILSTQFLLFMLGGYFLYSYSVDPMKKKLITIEYYAENEHWADVLKLAEKIEQYDPWVNFQVNRAYSHLGALPDRLFNYPQLLGVNGLIVDPATMVGGSTMPSSDLYFDLGFISESQHWAFEAQTLLPSSPRILKRLIMINLVNRKYNLAGKFLKILDQNMLYHDWVRKYSVYVSDTTLAASDQVIAEKRRFTPRKAGINLEILDGLKLLVETNPNNQMAYDYLLSFCILDSDFKDFIEYLPLYTRFNLKKMPRSWEEMLSIYIIRNKTKPAFVTPETISKTCIQKITGFNQTVSQFKGNLSAAKNTLKRDFGDTYWYYMVYLNPKVTKAQKN